MNVCEVPSPVERDGLLRSPTCGTYPPWLTWATSWPVRSLQSQRKAGGLCPSQRLAHRTLGSLVLLPKGAYLGTGKHYWVVSVLRTRGVYHLDTHLSRGYTAHMDKTSKQTTMRFTPQDMEAIARIRQLYGCVSDTAAVRLALRIVARGEGVPTTPAPNKERHSHPTP